MSLNIIQELISRAESESSFEFMRLESDIRTDEARVSNLENQRDLIEARRQTSLKTKTAASRWLAHNQTMKIIGYCALALSVFCFASGGGTGVVVGLISGLYGVIWGFRDVIYSDVRRNKKDYTGTLESMMSAITQEDSTIREIEGEIRNQQSIIARKRNELQRGQRYFYDRVLRQTLCADNNAALVDIEKAAYQELEDYRFDDADAVFSFLSATFPENTSYSQMADKSKKIRSLYDANKAQIMSRQYGIANSELLTRIISGEARSANKDGVEGFLELFWSQVLSEPLHYCSVVTAFEPLLQLSNEGWISIDLLAGLLYIDNKWGRNYAETLCPYYEQLLNDFLDEASTEKIENLASFSAWCNYPGMENWLKEGLSSRV